VQRYGREKDFTQILNALDEQGWGVDAKGPGRYSCKPPGGGPIIMVNANSNDIRALANAKAMLRKAGAKI